MFTRFAGKAMFVSLSAVATLATVAVAVPAHAAEYEGASRTVRYADLDLASAKGAATLKRRIATAATIVCGGRQREELNMVTQRNACRAAAIASAEPQMQILLAQAERGERLADASGAMLTVGTN